MSAKTIKIYRVLFGVAFLWNMVGAIPPLFDPPAGILKMYGVEMASSQTLGYLGWELFWVSVLLFGVGYLILSFNPLKNQALLWLAIAGKTYVGMRWIGMYVQDQSTLFACAGGVGDVLFALLFVWVGINVHRHSSEITS